jgi:lipoprotein-anchoring transpeptidase ErfK/SrfK
MRRRVWSAWRLYHDSAGAAYTELGGPAGAAYPDSVRGDLRRSHRRALPIPAVKLTGLDPTYLRTTLRYPGTEEPGTIVVDPPRRYLYLVQAGGSALRYGVGVGREGFGWSGTATIHDSRNGRTGIHPRR